MVVWPGASGFRLLKLNKLESMEGRRAETLNSMLRPTLNPTHRPLSSSFLRLPYRILNINQKKELLRGLWVNPKHPFESSGLTGWKLGQARSGDAKNNKIQ